MPSAVIKRIPNTRSVVARFQGTYSFTDISGIAPFKIIPAGDGSFTFDRGDGHREPLYARSEEHTSELQSLMRISYAVFCLKKKNRISNALFTVYNHITNTTLTDRET